MRISRLPIFITVPINYTVSEQPAPFFLIFHPPPHGALPASLSKHPHFHSIYLVDKQFHNSIILRTRTSVLVFRLKVSLS